MVKIAMTPQQTKLVQTSFASVRSIADTAAALFYGNIRIQGRKLMAMLEYIVAGLHRPETIMPAVQELGRRHADYGVQEAHYATVGTALLWALRQGLGPQCTPTVEAAWAATYTLLADTMQAAAAENAYGAEAMQTATSAEG